MNPAHLCLAETGKRAQASEHGLPPAARDKCVGWMELTEVTDL